MTVTFTESPRIFVALTVTVAEHGNRAVSPGATVTEVRVAPAAITPPAGTETHAAAADATANARPPGGAATGIPSCSSWTVNMAVERSTNVTSASTTFNACDDTARTSIVPSNNDSRRGVDESTMLMTKLKRPACVGVPLRAPVDASS